MSKSLDSRIRKIVPSVARLSYNPFFKLFVNLVSIVPDFFVKEFRELPPAHLRIRIGVGNRIFFNQARHLTYAAPFWLELLSKGLCTMESNIVEIGCGCGRMAWPLRGEQFSGK